MDIPSNCSNSPGLKEVVRPVFGSRKKVVRMEPGMIDSWTGTTGRT